LGAGAPGSAASGCGGAGWRVAVTVEDAIDLCRVIERDLAVVAAIEDHAVGGIAFIVQGIVPAMCPLNVNHGSVVTAVAANGDALLDRPIGFFLGRCKTNQGAR